MSHAASTPLQRAARKWGFDDYLRNLGPVLYERLGVTLMVLVVVLLSIVTLARPGYNWDMLPYVAAALENRIDDPVRLHAETWKEIEKGASEHDLHLLREGSPYQRHQWENPADFATQLPLYRVKVGYIAALRTLEPLTGLANAAILLSILPSLVFGALCLIWLKREDALQGALVLVPLLGLVDYLHMTTLATPDMTAALLSFGAVYLLTRDRDLLACVLLFATIFFRPDSLIQIFALLITAFLFGWRKTPFVVTFIAALVACAAISRFGSHPGWWTHFYFSNVEVQNALTGFDPAFSFASLAKGYVNGIMTTLTDYVWAELLVLAVLGWRLLNRAGKANTPRFNALMFAMVIGVLGKFASFPLPDPRIYFPYLAAMAILLVAGWKPRFERGRQSVRVHAQHRQ